MEEVRDQLVFQDHLVAAVRDWKNQIIAELKSDKNILFIGVHCRNDHFDLDSVLTVCIVQEDGLQASL